MRLRLLHQQPCKLPHRAPKFAVVGQSRHTKRLARLKVPELPTELEKSLRFAVLYLQTKLSEPQRAEKRGRQRLGNEAAVQINRKQLIKRVVFWTLGIFCVMSGLQFAISKFLIGPWFALILTGIVSPYVAWDFAKNCEKENAGFLRDRLIPNLGRFDAEIQAKMKTIIALTPKIIRHQIFLTRFQSEVGAVWDSGKVQWDACEAWFKFLGKVLGLVYYADPQNNPTVRQACLAMLEETAAVASRELAKIR